MKMKTQYRIVERTFSLVGGGEGKTWYPQLKLAWWPWWLDMIMKDLHGPAGFGTLKGAERMMDNVASFTIDRVVFQGH